jgi:long-chain acyl-CoA synthetase
METGTATQSGVEARPATMAAMASWCADRYGAAPALRFKRDGDWQELSYAEMGEAAAEIAAGLIELGVEAGDRVCILGNTRPEWSLSDLGVASAGAVSVPIYPSNSPEECEWVAGNSGAKAIICENVDQVDKITKVQGNLPELETIVAMDPKGLLERAVMLDNLRHIGRDGDRALVEQRVAGVKPDHPYTFVYTSGTTGPPKGCVLTHGSWSAVCDMIREIAAVREGDVSYLYLPLAHVFARVVQLCTFDLGATLAFFGGDTRQIVPELADARPTYFPSVPRMFEKIYTQATSRVQEAPPEQQEQFQKAISLGVKVRGMEQRGEEVPEKLRKAFEQADEQLFAPVRAIFGGQVRECATGAAPIAPDILEFFYACGIPVLEGYGMTETTAVATVSTRENFRFGTVGRALPGVEVRIADDGEVLIKGANIFKGYYRNDEATRETIVDGWLHTGDIGQLDEDGYLKITGRKKDIIITAGGKNLTPANIENDLKQSPWISQAVMHGDRRPFPVALITLDEEEIVPWAKKQGLATDMASLSKDPKVIELIQADLDRANAKYAQVEQIKKFTILDHDLSQESGELTPTLKVKRNVVNEKYAALLDSLYQK